MEMGKCAKESGHSRSRIGPPESNGGGCESSTGDGFSDVAVEGHWAVLWELELFEVDTQLEILLDRPAEPRPLLLDHVDEDEIDLVNVSAERRNVVHRLPDGALLVLEAILDAVSSTRSVHPLGMVIELGDRLGVELLGDEAHSSELLGLIRDEGDDDGEKFGRKGGEPVNLLDGGVLRPR